MVRLLSIGIECFSSMVFIFAFYSMAVFSAVGIPTAYTLRVEFSFNLIPLIDISSSPVEYIKNTILNILLFIPMGFLLPAIWKEYRPIKKTVLMGLSVSVIIELLQIFTFRLTDIDDLITNTLGTFLGYYCGKMLLVSNHHFKWWFIISPKKGCLRARLKGGYRKHCYWSSIKRYFCFLLSLTLLTAPGYIF